MCVNTSCPMLPLLSPPLLLLLLLLLLLPF
jgi:hypothetical protein